MPFEETKNALANWISHNKISMAKDDIEKKGWSIFRIKNRDFVFAYLIRDIGYKTVWGYYIGPNNTLECRHWYFSASESAWRVGTGFRWVDGGKGKDASLGWVKSAEGHGNHISGGYIYEAYVVTELEARLTEWVEGSLEKTIYCQASITSTYNVSGDDGIQNAYVALMINKLDEKSPDNNKLSAIVEQYAKERVNIIPLAGALFGLGANSTRDELDKAIQGSEKLRIGTTTRQMEYSVKKDAQGVFKKEFDPERGVNGLWDLIVSCLNGNPATTGPFVHEVLKSKYWIDSYRLGLQNKENNECVFIEIAYTEAVDLEYRQYSLETIASVKSPICWVRSAYVSENYNPQYSYVSTFGNRTLFAADLAFLVQKPCDYSAQTSPGLQESIGYSEGVIYRDPASNRNVLAGVRINKMNSVSKEGGGLYLLLALHNETTSPLIKKFKQNKGFQLFKGKYSIRGSVQGDPNLVMLLRDAIYKGVEAYISFHTVGKRKNRHAGSSTDARAQGRHTTPGINRARVFSRLISPANENYDPINLSNDFYQLFANNKVNGAREGWSFMDSINTSAGSLFTFVCIGILDCVTIEREDKYRERVSDHLNKFKSQTLAATRGPSNSIQRLIIKALTLDIDQFEGVTEAQSALLLQAVRER